MEALLQAAEEDTREDPLFDDPDDLDFDEDMAQLMRQVYSAFKNFSLRGRTAPTAS